MAKYVVVYPNHYKRTVYVTTELISNPHETEGRTRNFLGVSRVYIRQGKPVIRKPGVFRRSKHVAEVNEVLKNVKGELDAPAVRCAGLPWKEFKRCLSKQLKSLLSSKYTPENELEVGYPDFARRIGRRGGAAAPTE